MLDSNFLSKISEIIQVRNSRLPLKSLQSSSPPEAAHSPGPSAEQDLSSFEEPGNLPTRDCSGIEFHDIDTWHDSGTLTGDCTKVGDITNNGRKVGKNFQNRNTLPWHCLYIYSVK